MRERSYRSDEKNGLGFVQSSIIKALCLETCLETKKTMKWKGELKVCLQEEKALVAVR